LIAKDLAWSLQGGKPMVLDAEYISIAREVAMVGGATVIDAGTELNLTPYVYTDFCHFDEEGHRIVAQLLHQKILELL
jgi:hypothetical protein